MTNGAQVPPMPGAPKNKTYRTARPAARTAVKTVLPAVQQVADLAWAGQHANAIDLATTSRASAGVTVGIRLGLLDLRAES